MVNYGKDAVFELKNYLWHKLKEDNIFDETDYSGISFMELVGDQTVVPIIPVQQSPVISDNFSGLDHIVYDKIGISYEQNWIICCEQIMFTTYSTSYDRITEIRNYMIDLFRRMDESARDINNWSGKSAEFKFHTIHIADISPTAPSPEIQGYFAEELVIEIKYSRHVDQVTKRFI